MEWSVDWIPGVTEASDEDFKKAFMSSDAIYMSFEQREHFRDAYDYWKDKTLAKMVEGAMTPDMWDAFGNGCILNGTIMGRHSFNSVSGMPQGITWRTSTRSSTPVCSRAQGSARYAAGLERKALRR